MPEYTKDGISMPPGWKPPNTPAQSKPTQPNTEDDLEKMIANVLNQYHMDALTEVPKELSPYIQPILDKVSTRELEARIDELEDLLDYYVTLKPIAKRHYRQEIKNRLAQLKKGEQDD